MVDGPKRLPETSSIRSHRGQPLPDYGNEVEQVVETIAQDVFDDVQIDGVVSVDEDISKADHVAKGRGQCRRDPAGSLQQIEELPVPARLSEPFVGHDVRSGIECRLDGQLKSVLDEPPLPDVLPQHVEAGERAQLTHAGFDLCELLGDEVGVRQDAARSTLR